MNKSYVLRMKKVIDNAIKSLELELSNLTVFTEAASGNYVVSPLIAAIAGAKQVIAITRDSRFGTAKEVEKFTLDLAKNFGVANKINIIFEKEKESIYQADIVTNLGFVRPIDETFINFMKSTAVIPLMWETWEFRDSDIDIYKCRQKGIIVLGTNERLEKLEIFRYVGVLALKLLLEVSIEVYKSRILLISSTHFAENIFNVLEANDAEVLLVDISNTEKLKINDINEFIKNCDAIVIAEQTSEKLIIGQDGIIDLDYILQENPSVRIVHISGNIDSCKIKENNICIIPEVIAPPKYMSLSTDYVGIKPIVYLHTAGLKVGETMARCRLKGMNEKETISYCIKNSPAMDFE